MQPIIPPVPADVLASELTRDKFVRNTNYGKNEIYIVTYHNSPNVVKEIGRLRELTFRYAGGGTGKPFDLDEFDTNEKPYKQLIVWSPEDKAIVGSYRFLCCKDAPVKNDIIQLATVELFEFSSKFLKDYFPTTIELGRSFVQPDYQPSSANRKGLFSLDNLWDGLGALVVDYPDMKYFFGKVTMYRDFNVRARDMILYFMKYYFPNKESLVVPIDELPLNHDMRRFAAKLKDKDYKEGHAILNQAVRALGENIPPLVNSYMNLSSTMKTFGTCLNPEFGDVEETGILVTIPDIYPSKKERHIDSYLKQKEKLKRHS
ncbi:MAG TPA: GNAT family N-acetyltransferase [Bacteroidia bacterium]|nr:GNAT family N-acetyltransferase [Bacteroidia bacterium]